MKKLVLSIFMALLFVCFSTNLQADASSFREVKAVSGSSLIVKSTASTNATSVITLKRGEFVTVLSTANGWSYVQVKNVKGYVNSSFLTKPSSTMKIASSKGGLVVKELPSKSAKTSATLTYQMIVQDFGSVGNGWNFVQYGNVTGYVASTFIAVPKKTTKSTSTKVDVRNIASSKGEVVATLAKDTKVQVATELAGWAYVISGKTSGYVEGAKLAKSTQSSNSVAATFVQIANYLPACPSTYVYKLTDDYIGTQYQTYTCEFVSGGRKMNATFNADSTYSFTANGDLFVQGSKAADRLYKKTLRVGDSWTSEAGYNFDMVKYYVKSINDTVTTPSGTYRNVVKIDEYYESSFLRTVYLAPGYGEVKIELSGTVFELYSVTK